MKRKTTATQIVRKRYNVIAPIYDWVVQTAERGQSSSWRSLLWKRVEGKDILEVGVGTGLNFAYADTVNYNLTAIDISDGMLVRARRKADRAHLCIKILRMDVQNLEFQNSAFDTVLASFLFCSVTDPLMGLREVKRVCKPDGKVILLEHGLSENHQIAWLMNLAAPAIAWITGAEHINRKVEELVEQSGLRLENVSKLDSTGVFKMVEARKT